MVRTTPLLFGLFVGALATHANAQCFSRNSCDPNTFEVRSQLNISVPVADTASGEETMKAMDDARQKLTTFSGREYENIKSTFGNDALVRSTNVTSNVGDGGFRGKNIFVSMMNVYEVKKPK